LGNPVMGKRIVRAISVETKGTPVGQKEKNVRNMGGGLSTQQKIKREIESRNRHF